MQHTYEEVLKFAQDLTELDRVRLIQSLSETVNLDGEEDEAEVEAAWGEEIKRRLDEIDSGKVQMLSYEEFRADMDAHITSKLRAAQRG